MYLVVWNYYICIGLRKLFQLHVLNEHITSLFLLSMHYSPAICFLVGFDMQGIKFEPKTHV